MLLQTKYIVDGLGGISLSWVEDLSWVEIDEQAGKNMKLEAMKVNRKNKMKKKFKGPALIIF